MNKVILLFFIFLIFFTACQQENFQTANAKDIEDFTTWKEIDTTQNKYVLYKFNGTEYKKEFYATKDFNDLIDVHTGEIIKTEGDHMLISMDDGGLYDCSVCPSTDNKSMTFTCKPQNGIGNESCTTLWKYK